MLPTGIAILARVSFLAFITVVQSANIDCTGIKAVDPRCKSDEVGMIRDFFYIGGEYVYEPDYSSSIYSGQMYVEKLRPLCGPKRKHPIVFISAGIPSGVAWLNTPDNRRGWASYFIEQGYIVYIVDTTSVGRSSQEELSIFPLGIGSTVNITEDGFTAPEILDPYPQSQGHTQWPGNGTRGDPYFDAFMAAILPLTTNSTSQESSMRAAGCDLLSMIGESYLISHSAGSTYSILMSDECPELVRASINIEPGNIPFQGLYGNDTVAAVGRTRERPCGLTNTPIAYDPPVSNCSQLDTHWVGEDRPGNRSCVLQNAPARQLPNIARVPYVAVTGSASPHITYDHCTIGFLNQAGVKAEWIRLGQLGITGNGHFMFMEKNNLEIAAVVERWIRNH